MTLVSLKRLREQDQGILGILSILGQSGPSLDVEPGLVVSRSWSPQYAFAVKEFDFDESDWVFDWKTERGEYFSSWGVCDSPAQFKDTPLYARMASDPRPMCVFFVHVAKDPDSEGGGWRWHKWGQYIGLGTPSCEYLDDEEKFDDGVYTYHAYLVA